MQAKERELAAFKQVRVSDDTELRRLESELERVRSDLRRVTDGKLDLETALDEIHGMRAQLGTVQEAREALVAEVRRSTCLTT